MVTRSISQRLPDGKSILTAVAFVLLINLVGGLPGVFSSPDTAWFRSLEKPWFTRLESRFRSSDAAVYPARRRPVAGLAQRHRRSATRTRAVRRANAVQRGLDARVFHARGTAGRAGESSSRSGCSSPGRSSRFGGSTTPRCGPARAVSRVGDVRGRAQFRTLAVERLRRENTETPASSHRRPT